MDNQKIAERCMEIAKELIGSKIQIVHTGEEPPEIYSKSIFLAGPTPRDKNVPSWRPEAIKELEKLNYDGVVFYPEFAEGSDDYGKDEIMAWEREHLCMADVVLFWVPRKLDTMPAYTTNVEFGTWIDSGKTVFGYPLGSDKNGYLDWLYTHVAKEPVYHSLQETIKAAVDKVGPGAERIDAERKIPLQIWNTPQFQQWYSHLLSNNNRLDDARQMWVFKMPKKGVVFSFVLWVKVWIESEKRHKENEWIFSRTNISTVVLYDGSLPKTEDFRDTRVVIVKEFRSPACNEEGFVYECPSGSDSADMRSPIENAKAELEEETGLDIPESRFVKVSTRQVAATLSTHFANVYAVALTKEEMDKIIPKTQTNQYYGLEYDTERTYVKVFTVRQLLYEEIPIDWANLGIILCTVLGGYRAR